MIATQVPRIRSIYPLVVALVLLGTQAVAQGRTRDLTQAEARDLVIEVLDASARKLPGLAFDFNAFPNVPSFYKLAVTWDNPNGSPLVGHFAVNRATGDVWQLVVCERIVSADLKRLQRSMRKRIGLSPKELRELGAKAPCEG